MKVRNLIIFGMLLGSNPLLYAHEGHDHGTPGAVKSYNGGTVQPAKNADVEMLQLGSKVLLYVLNAQTKPLPTSEVQINAELRNERTQKVEPLTLKTEKEGFSFERALGSDRHSLLLTLVYKKETSPLKFTIESQQ